MTNKKLSLWQKMLIGAAGLLPLGATSALAQQATTQPDYKPAAATQPVEKPVQNDSKVIGVRTRFEGTSGEDALGRSYSNFRTTLGLTDPKSSYGEWLRVYDDWAKFANGDRTHCVSGAAMEEVNLGGWTVIPEIFGVSGDGNKSKYDKEGIGTELKFTRDKLFLTLNAEQAELPARATRLGAGLDYKFTNWLTAGAGFDQVETAAGTTNVYTSHGFFEATKTDRIGAGVKVADLEGNVTNSVIADWMHYNDSWGTRSWVKYDWNNDASNQFNCTTFDSIWAQRPIFGRGDYTWSDWAYFLEDRAQGGLLNCGVVNAATNSERTPLNFRAKYGFVGELSGSRTQKPGFESSYIRGDIGYTFLEMDLGGIKVKPGALIFARHDESGKGDGCDTFGASGIVNFGKIFGGDACFEATGCKRSDGSSEVYGGLQWRRSW